LAWEAGFRRLSLDMMTGLPDQTLQDVRETLDLILSLPVDHVSSYALTLAPDTPLHALMERSPGRFPDDDLERRMTHEVKARLEASGFEHYEISNFARPGARSRHNSVYWQADPYLAAGPAAASYLGGVRRCNPASLEEWLRLFEDPGEGPLGPRTMEELVDEKAARVETMILGLRLLEGVTFQRFMERHQVSMDACFGPALARLEEEGLIQRDPAGVRLSSKGLDFADKVWRALL
jgi:oxygen-independent coproporphyrinogen-3 oxidase